jgi:MOSC domain-containing protein YiiM
VKSGRVEWIGVRPKKGAPMEVVKEVRAIAGRGLEGDRASAREGHKRQVTLIQAEHLEVVAKLAGVRKIDPARLRRNVVVSGINLVSLLRKKFRVGDLVLVGTDTADPCFQMEELEAAMAGMGGITARILEGGTLRVGDRVTLDAPDVVAGSVAPDARKKKTRRKSRSRALARIS